MLAAADDKLVAKQAYACFVTLLYRAWQMVTAGVQVVHDHLRSWTTPSSTARTFGSIYAVARSTSQLVIEHAVLRQQRIVLNRSVKRPRLRHAASALVVLLARRLPWWKAVLRIVKPDTVFRWQRHGLRLVWKRKSPIGSRRPKVAAETITLIKAMAANNPLWGADRMRGALLKLAINVAKRTTQRSMRPTQPARPRGQRGQHSSAITPTISGPVTFCPSPISSSGRSWRSSVPRVGRAASSTLESHARRPPHGVLSRCARQHPLGKRRRI